MDQGIGNELPGRHRTSDLRPSARWLVLIESGGFMLARLFDAGRQQLAEFDASTEEAVQMAKGQPLLSDAQQPEWDQALMGHSLDERRQAQVYALGV
ncbi:MAG: hypothetical protein JO006_07370 [Paucibacter sp.]|nr:hypothetical protein [Roseateles sp.]